MEKDLKIADERSGVVDFNQEFAEFEEFLHNRQVVDSLTNSSVRSKVEDWEKELLEAILHFSPQKFDDFITMLLGRLGIRVERTSSQPGIRESNQLLVGYVLDPLTLRTNRLAISLKRLHADVTQNEIQRFQTLVAQSKVDYGLFIATTRFTEQAKNLALGSTPPITLIDGLTICDLVAKYELFVTEVVRYELGDYYKNRT